MPDQYWNHNVAYHRWVGAAARRLRGDALDVGCGEGLLLERLAPVCRSVLGLEPDAVTAERARRRVARLGPRAGVEVASGDFLGFEFGRRRFDLVVFVASLHHLDLAAALTKARGLVRPGGELLVVGLARNGGPLDWLVAVLQLPVVRLASWLHREQDPGVPIAEPAESLGQIRAVARRLLPGVRIRRGLYYRYLLRWRAPGGRR